MSLLSVLGVVITAVILWTIGAVVPKSSHRILLLALILLWMAVVIITAVTTRTDS